MQDVVLKAGDLSPQIGATLTAGNPALPVNLTGAAVSLQYALPYLGVTFTKVATVMGDPTGGNVAYQWLDGDTVIPGEYEARWIVTDSGGRPRSFPNDRAFRLTILPNTPAARYNVLRGGGQTAVLLRRLRRQIADTTRLLYPDENSLVQLLMDTFEEFLVDVQLVDQVDILAPDADAYDPEDPLATDSALGTQQQDVWVLMTAKKLLETEVLEAARLAASIRSPAGQMNMQEIYKALFLCLERVDGRLSEVLNLGSAGIRFIDLTTLDGRVLESA